MMKSGAIHFSDRGLRWTYPDCCCRSWNGSDAAFQVLRQWEIWPAVCKAFFRQRGLSDDVTEERKNSMYIR